MCRSVLMFVLVLLVGIHHVVSTLDRQTDLIFDKYPGQKLTLPQNLTGAKQASTLVDDNMGCVFECTGVHWCGSINVKTTPQSNGLYVCELLSSDQFTSKDSMSQDNTYDHYSVKNPCQEKPCRNDGECIFEDNREDYRCKCKEGLTGEHCEKAIWKNCEEVLKYGGKQSGVYSVDPDGKGAFKVYCDQNTTGGGWTVFQKRQDGSVDFYRGWNDYKKGFGNLTGELWLGLDNIHRLTQQNRNRLRVELDDFEGGSAYAEYDYFSVSSEQSKYTLSLGSYSGTAGDSLSYHRGMVFSTKDRDNDKNSGNCAVGGKGAWWYNTCYHSNLNGLYLQGPVLDSRGVNWRYWKVNQYSAKRAEMKIRPV